MGQSNHPLVLVLICSSVQCCDDDVTTDSVPQANRVRFLVSKCSIGRSVPQIKR